VRSMRVCLLQLTFNVRPKIVVAPVAGQALLPKKTLRRKVSLGKYRVRSANGYQVINEPTDMLKAPRGYDLFSGLAFVCVNRG
jgi:hypothetical protein